MLNLNKLKDQFMPKEQILHQQLLKLNYYGFYRNSE